jgi:hypothetical protein
VGECIDLNSRADSETVSVQRQGAIEKALLYQCSPRSFAALLGVNLFEPLRVQDSIKAWSVLQKDQYPQNGGEDAWTDRCRCHREMKGKDVEDFSSQEDERQRYEVSREQKQSGYELDSEEESREVGCGDRDEELQS